MDALMEQIKAGFDAVNNGQKLLADGQSRLIDRMDQVDEKIEIFDDSVKDLTRKFDDHVKADHDHMTQIQAALKSIVPGGDFDGHRKAHEIQMTKAQRWHDTKQKVLVKILEWSAIGILGFFVVTFLAGLKVAT